MCTFIILRRPDHDWPVVIGANRDEMINRPWLPPGRHWPDRAEIVAGLDVLAGGTWLGVNEHGVVAGILNRSHSLGPQLGRRSRGELVLEALDHADAHAAAAALRRIEPASYRPFNLVIADNRDGFWLRHADPTGTMPVAVTPLPPGLSMLTSGDIDDMESPRIRDYRERFLAAPPPDPESGDLAAWEALLGDTVGDRDSGPSSAMNFATPSGFATLSSTLLALPAIGHSVKRPLLRFMSRRPDPAPWAEFPV
jgi:uncharacterized protein with NRDE domain